MGHRNKKSRIKSIRIPRKVKKMMTSDCRMAQSTFIKMAKTLYRIGLFERMMGPFISHNEFEFDGRAISLNK